VSERVNPKRPVCEVNTMSIFSRQPLPFLLYASITSRASVGPGQRKVKTLDFSVPSWNCWPSRFLILKVFSLKCPISALDPYPGTQADVFEVQGDCSEKNSNVEPDSSFLACQKPSTPSSPPELKEGKKVLHEPNSPNKLQVFINLYYCGKLTKT
jgi:hypothetical protein